jgi:hypothetical protein
MVPSYLAEFNRGAANQLSFRLVNGLERGGNTITTKESQL